MSEKRSEELSEESSGELGGSEQVKELSSLATTDGHYADVSQHADSNIGSLTTVSDACKCHNADACKRHNTAVLFVCSQATSRSRGAEIVSDSITGPFISVSYTHLTLPTKRIV